LDIPRFKVTLLPPVDLRAERYTESGVGVCIADSDDSGAAAELAASHKFNLLEAAASGIAAEHANPPESPSGIPTGHSHCRTVEGLDNRDSLCLSGRKPMSGRFYTRFATFQKQNVRRTAGLFCESELYAFFSSFRLSTIDGNWQNEAHFFDNCWGLHLSSPDRC
jgi:hypothetical protein